MVTDLNPRIRLLAFVLGLPALLAASAAQAEDAALIVHPGDTLISIAQRYLDRPERWRAVKTLNAIPDEYRLVPGSRVRLPARWLKWTGGEAEAINVQGSPSVNGAPLASGMRLAQGDTVDTGADGIVTLRTGAGASIVLAPGTRIRLGVLQRVVGMPVDRTAVELQAGSTENQVPSLKGTASRFEIRTPRVVTAVRGTRFRVAAAGASSRHEVVEGKVDVAGSKGRASLAPGQGLLADGGRVGRPVGLLSAPNTTGLPARIERTVARLSVPAMNGAAAWRWQLSADAAFTQVIRNVRTATPEWFLAGVPDGDYFIALRAVDAAGLEGRDVVAAIAVRARPEPPLMLRPAAGGMVVGRAALAWAEAADAAASHLQVARDAGFAEVVVDEPALARRDFAADLPPGDYWWRLASRRADGYRGPFGDAVRFRILAPTEMAPPTLTEDSLSLAWSGPADLRYRLQLAGDEGFAQPRETREVDGVHATLPLPPAGVWYARTQPQFPDGSAGPWSAVQRIEVPASPWLLLLMLLPAL
jgi:hypothetical protein